MGYFSSVFKGLKLHSISKRLAAPLSAKDILSGAALSRRDAALEELLALCESDTSVRQVMQQHGLTRQDLGHVYALLRRAGADSWVGAHFVAASTLAFGQTLDYAVRRLLKPEDAKPNLPAVASRLILYFERGEVGLVSD